MFSFFLIEASGVPHFQSYVPLHPQEIIVIVKARIPQIMIYNSPYVFI